MVKTADVAAIFLALGVLVLLLRPTRPKRRPPGPSSLPFLGNIWRFNPKSAWFKLTKLQAKYGDLICYHGLGNTILVLNSLGAINDLLDKRSTVYSHRPEFTVAGELMGLGQSMPLLPYGPEWRAHRKLAHLALSPSAVTKYHHIQEDLAALLISNILADPDQLFSYVRLTSGCIILVVTYGLTAKNAHDHYIADAESTMNMVTKATVPGAFLADLVPFLKHLKWLSFHKEAEVGRRMIENFITKPFLHVQKDMSSATAPPSLARDLLEQLPDDDETHKHRIKWTTGAMYGAGAETTYTTVLVFVLAMAQNPGVQRKAQMEIDRLIPSGRLPRVADRQHLPYVESVIKECLRWHPALPLSIARRTAEDDDYRGYHIPKGTVVIPNVWAIAFAPNQKYPPHDFIPERFLDKSVDIPNPMNYAFGFGRRVCPGKALGENSVFIIIAHLLSVFNILPPEGGLAPPAFGPNLVSYPEPFECQLIPRSEEVKDLVEASAAECSI